MAATLATLAIALRVGLDIEYSFYRWDDELGASSGGGLDR